MKKFFALTAMCGTMLSPVLSTAARADVVPTVIADGADADTLAAMQNQCTALAEARDTENGDIWTGAVVLGASSQLSGPTEIGTHDISDAIGDPVGAGTFTPAHVEILGDPYRNGGSVNMFGMQQSVGGRYSASTYSFIADYASVFAYSFSCDISRAVYHPESTIRHPAVGIYVIAGDFGESEAAVRGNCAAFTAQGDNDPQPDWYGEPFRGGSDANPHCQFQGTAAYDEVIEEYHDPATVVGNVAGIPINQDQTDTLTAFEDAGEGFDTDETLLIGQVVVCISPTTSTSTKKGAPGTWRQQNGYAGNKCTTEWYTGGAMVGVPNLNTGSNNWVTVPVV